MKKINCHTLGHSKFRSKYFKVLGLCQFKYSLPLNKIIKDVRNPSDSFVARCKSSKDRTHYYRPLKQNAEPFTVMELFRGQGVINFLANKGAFANMV